MAATLSVTLACALACCALDAGSAAATGGGAQLRAASAHTALIGSAESDQTLNVAAIKSALEDALAVSGKAARRSSVLAADGYRTQITAPVEAYVRIQWTIVRTLRGKRTKVIVATTTYPLIQGGATQAMKISLTGTGRRLLRSSHGALKLTATGRFLVVPTTFAVTLSRSVTLTG